LTVLFVAVSKKNKGNQYFGLAIGAALLAGAYAAGPISGGALNPAVGLGPLLFDMSTWSQHGATMLLYIVGPLAGGAAAALVYKQIEDAD
jgi:aquaporin Z